MKTHEITTSKCEFVVMDMEHNSWFQNTPLPEGYTIEGFIKLSDATEGDLYVNGFRGNNLVDELHSLLKSKGIDINNGNWYLFKKV